MSHIADDLSLGSLYLAMVIRNMPWLQTSLARHLAGKSGGAEVAQTQSPGGGNEEGGDREMTQGGLLHHLHHYEM